MFRLSISNFKSFELIALWPEDFSLKVESCSHMKFIIIYNIVAID
jgi:hypothetical protein